jgi:glycosyltransferase involved in cell wall biosynthesis
MTKAIKKPFFSIVIPTLNEEVYLPQLLKDLYEQSWEDFEIIHVDGGSSDRTIEEASGWKNKLKIKTINYNIKNVSSQRNAGAKAASGEWIIFMDADNRLPSYFLVGLRYRIEKAEENKLKKFDMFSTLVHLNSIDKANSKNHVIANFTNFFLRTTGKTEKPMVLGSMVGIRREIIKSVQFNSNNKVCEDSIFTKNCIKAGWKYRVLTNPTYAYSLRRFKSNGSIKTATTSVAMNLKYLLGDDFSESDCGYSMLGGSVYNEKNIIDKESKFEDDDEESDD